MKFVCLALALLLCGCAAQIEQKLKTAPLLSPEALGGFSRFELGAGEQSAPYVAITDDARYDPPDRAVSYVDQETKIFLYGGMGLFRRLDVSLDPASWLNAKLQVWGEPYDTAKAGNFSCSLFASGWHEKDDGLGDDVNSNNNHFISVAPNVHYNKKDDSWRLGALAGYRLAGPFLLYGGFSHQEHRYSGDYAISGGASGRYAGRATAAVWTLGGELSFGKAVVLRLEDAYSTVKVPAFGARSSQHSVGLLLEGVFGAGGSRKR